MTVSLAVLGSTAGAERPDVAVTVERPAQASVIPPAFLGLSMEYRTVETYAGPDPSAPNPLFPRLVRALAPGQAPVLRIGGDSTDRTWWPTPGLAQPPGVNLTLDSRWLDVTRTLTKTLGARLILGLNLEAGSASVVASEANAFISGLGARSIRAFELGNEPDLYGRFAWYRTPSGTKVNGRPHDYDVTAFTQDFSNAAAELPAGIPLAGPGFGTLGWNKSVGQFLGAAPRVGLVTLHRYPLQHCFIKPQNPRYPTLANLLSPTASTGLADLFAPYVTVARAHHLPAANRRTEHRRLRCRAVGEPDLCLGAVVARHAVRVRPRRCRRSEYAHVHRRRIRALPLHARRRLAGDGVTRIQRPADVRPGDTTGVAAAHGGPRHGA